VDARRGDRLRKSVSFALRRRRFGVRPAIGLTRREWIPMNEVSLSLSRTTSTRWEKCNGWIEGCVALLAFSSHDGC
jgi:hypothetical protein